MRTSTRYGIVLTIIVVIVIALISFALSIDRIDILAQFLGILLGFSLAYVAAEGLRRWHEEKEADQILADVQVELDQLLEYLDELELTSFVSATGSWIKSQGLTYIIPRDVRKKVLDVFTTLENYNSLVKDFDDYKLRPYCDADQLTSMEESIKEKEKELREEAKLALDAIKSR